MTSPYLPVPLTQPTQPVASERPYRSLSFPDINYTVLRPASLPPSPLVKNGAGNVITPGTTPPLPVTGATAESGSTLTAGLESLSQYGSIAGTPFVRLQPFLAPMNQGPPRNTANGNMNIPFQYLYDPGLKNPYLGIQFANVNPAVPLPTNSPLAPPYKTPTYPPTVVPAPVTPAPFPPPIPPTPALRLFQIPDDARSKGLYTSNASPASQLFATAHTNADTARIAGLPPADQDLSLEYTVNRPTRPQSLSTGIGNKLTNRPTIETPPFLAAATRSFFLPDNFTPSFLSTADTGYIPTKPLSPANNYLGSGPAGLPTNDLRQHPLYRTEWLQKVMNLTTVRTHQFAVWITVGFFEVVKPGTPELGLPDVLGQELGLNEGRNTRYRSFFTLDRTKATGFNPYNPGNFRDCVTYRRRIE